MQVKDVMTTPVVTVGPDSEFSEIVEQLLVHGIGGVPVVDERGIVLGIVTEADLVSNEAYGYRRRRGLMLIADYLRGRDPGWVRKAGALTARQLMTSHPVCAFPDEPLQSVARRMLEARHSRMPVVENGRLVGIIARHDLLQPFYRPDEDLLREIVQLLDDPLRMPETNNARVTVQGGVVSLSGIVDWEADVKIVESVLSRVPGVIAVDNRLVARDSEPVLQAPGPGLR